jgi:hypothetical protein
VQDLHFGALAEELADQVVRRSHAGRGVGELVRIGLGVGDEIARALDRHLRIHHHHVGHDRHHADRREILVEVVGELRVSRLRDRVMDRSHEKRVAVGRRLRGFRRAERAARAAAVLDHDLLAPFFRQLRADHARQQIGRSARRERHDPADRLGGILLRMGSKRHQCKGGDKQGKKGFHLGWS